MTSKSIRYLAILSAFNFTDAVRYGPRQQNRSPQLVPLPATLPLDPDVKIQLEQAWGQWTSKCTSEVDESDPLNDIKLAVEKARAEKLDRMRRGREILLSHQMMLQIEREVVVQDIPTPWVEPEPTEDDRPKPVTPRNILRALKAHPKSASRRR